MTAINIIIWVCLAIQLYFTISAGIRHFKYRKDGMLWYKERLESYCKEYDKAIQKEINRLVDVYKDQNDERWTLLSKENGRLLEENQVLRDKLKNLGFSDISLKQ